MLFIVLGGILATHWYTFFLSIKKSNIGIALITLATFPIITALIEPLYNKRKIKLSDILLACITTIGVYIIIPKTNHNEEQLIGIILGIISALTFSILAILNRKIVKRYSGNQILQYQSFFAIFWLIPSVINKKLNMNIENTLLLALLGTVFTAIPHSLFITGMKTVKAKTASLITNIEPIYGIVAMIVILDNKPTLNLIVDGSIILTATIYETVKNK